MQTLYLFHQRFSKFIIPISLITIIYFFTKSPYFLENTHTLSFAISADLLITIPVIYFLLIRKTSIPKTTVVPLMLLGLLVGFYVLPEENQYYLQLFKTWFLPIIELSVITFVIYKVRKAVLFHKSQNHNSTDFFTALQKTCSEIFPKPVVVPFTTEVAVFYYGFIDWKKRKLAENEFSYHKESGSVALFYGLLLLVAVEITPIHILLAKWSEIAAWVLTFLSIYSGFQVFGYARSLAKRPIIVENNVLLLRYGIMQEAEIPLKEIKNITLSSKDIEKDENIARLALLGELESHNMIIETHSEQILRGLFGTNKRFTKIALHVDQKSELKKYIEELL